MNLPKIIISAGIVVIITAWLGIQISDRIYFNDRNVASEDSSEIADDSPTEVELVHNPPSMDDVPEGPLGEAITYGYNLVNETPAYAEAYVGNELSCTSCHAGAGLEELGSSFVGVTTQYPQYRPREGIVFTLEDRVNGCMIRSMNGEPFPEDSEEMRAMMAYFTYISEGIPMGADIPWREANNMEDVPVPDLANGEVLYQQSCIACHGEDGSGTGPNTGPALWGDNSFNDGAGMTRFSKMTAFIQNNMPPGGEGSLSDQEASDIAAFILQHERPEFPWKDEDFPHGGKPSDFIDKEKQDQIKDGTIDWEEVVGKK